MQWYEVAGNVLYYATLPVVKLLLLIVYILRWILSPFIFIGSSILHLCWIPVNIAAKFEAIWYFIGCAILIGCLAALLNYGILRTIILVFKLDRRPPPQDRAATGHNARSYRKARERKKKQAEKERAEVEARARALADSPLLRDALKNVQRASQDDSPGDRLRRGGLSLLDQTIVERSSEDSM